MKDLYTIDRRFILKARIKALAVEIRTLKNQKSKILRYARGLNEEPDAQSAQRILANHLVEMAPRQQSRHALLAYAFVRGKSYASVERTVHEGHTPYPALIATLAYADMPVWTGEIGNMGFSKKQNDYIKGIEAWLKVRSVAAIEKAA